MLQLWKMGAMSVLGWRELGRVVLDQEVGCAGGRKMGGGVGPYGEGGDRLGPREEKWFNHFLDLFVESSLDSNKYEF